MADITFYKNIPFAPDGSFTMDFLSSGGAFSEATRSTYLEGSSRFYTSIALGEAVYIRDNAPFRVPYNIDALRNAGVNYFRFRNVVPDVTPAVYSRYYYGFIDKMTLAAADTTEIEWHIDPLQTYLSEIYSETYQQKIERCHQDRFDSSMSPVFNTLPDINSGKRKLKSYQKIVAGDIGYYVLICTEQLKRDSFDSSARTTPPEIVQNNQNSFWYYVIPAFKNYSDHSNQHFKAASADIIDIFSLNTQINQALIFQAASPYVVGMYYTPIPPVKIQWTKSGNNYILSNTDEIEAVDGGLYLDMLMFKTLRVKKTTSIRYTPISQSGFAGLFNTSIISDNVSISSPYNAQSARNPLRETKLYTSDYTPIHFTDYSSNSIVVKNELIPKNILMSFSGSFSLVGSPTLYVELFNYSGGIAGVSDFKNETSNEVPFISDTYAETMSRKKASIVGSLVSTALSAGLSAAKGYSINAFAHAASGAISAGETIGDAYFAPDTVKSISNDITPSLARGYNDFIIYYEMPINAVELCDFWALYGYPYDKPAKLSDVINTRYRFNYVKTGGARLPSVTYTEHKKALEALLDGGVTFWHNHAGTFAAIGDYSKENAEMSLL